MKNPKKYVCMIAFKVFLTVDVGVNFDKSLRIFRGIFKLKKGKQIAIFKLT